MSNKDGQNGAPDGQASTRPNTTPKQAAGGPGIGDPARDGKFEFVVKNVKCGVQSVGEGLTKTPQGQFCLVTVTVKNIGDEPQTMFDANQKGIGSNSAKYSTDSEAGLYANSANAQVWITDINPGNQVTGILVFDLPKNTELAQLEMHDSAFSGGVGINVK